MRLRLPSIPSVPMPRRITLRWKLAGLLIFIGVLLVALAMVSLASLAKVSDGGQHNFAHVTQPLAALGNARALVSQNAGAGRSPHPRGHPRDQAPARAAHPGQPAPDRPRARAAAPTFTTAQERKSARFLKHNLAVYRSVTAELFGVSRANSPELAYEWSSQRLDPAADTLNADLQHLYDAKVAEGNALAHEAKTTFYGARRLVLALLAPHLPHRHPGVRVHDPRHPPQRGGDRRAPGLPAPPRRRRPARRARAPGRRRPDLRADARHAADPPAHARRDRRRGRGRRARSATTPQPRWRPTTPPAPRWPP